MRGVRTIARSVSRAARSASSTSSPVATAGPDRPAEGECRPGFRSLPPCTCGCPSVRTWPVAPALAQGWARGRRRVLRCPETRCAPRLACRTISTSQSPEAPRSRRRCWPAETRSDPARRRGEDVFGARRPGPAGRSGPNRQGLQRRAPVSSARLGSVHSSSATTIRSLTLGRAAAELGAGHPQRAQAPGSVSCSSRAGTTAATSSIIGASRRRRATASGHQKLLGLGVRCWFTDQRSARLRPEPNRLSHQAHPLGDRSRVATEYVEHEIVLFVVHQQREVRGRAHGGVHCLRRMRMIRGRVAPDG